MTFPDFAQFFEACHDAAPYCWQKRLVDQVITDQRWPGALDLPTGSGKTSVIDIALYALAAAAHEGDFGLFPRRIILVVDRRVLVDQAWRHGRRILERIETETKLASVRKALARLSVEPASSIRLRGACPTDPRWCRSPDQVQIVASTVDQIWFAASASRPMASHGACDPWRPGWSVKIRFSSWMRPTWPAPFLDTLAHLERLTPVRGIAPRHQRVQLSATPTTTATVVRFGLKEEDRNDAALAPRLVAQKIVSWSDERVEQVLTTIEAPCVLLVANTVRTALEWFGKVTKAQAARRLGALERKLFLVTGRMRPLDRQTILDAVENRLDGRQPTVVVATQCIEAGVDWDFDAMISECASWDALVQRMGRVNRRGGTRRRDVHHHPSPKGPSKSGEQRRSTVPCTACTRSRPQRGSRKYRPCGARQAPCRKPRTVAYARRRPPRC